MIPDTDSTTAAAGDVLTPDRRAELLAIADPGALTALADDCLAHFGDPVILMAPETGLVMLQVREPVCEERFHLGEVVVTRAEVTIAGGHGWAMRIGTDRLATLAAAICDAVADAHADDTPPTATHPTGAHLAEAVVALCRQAGEAAVAAARSEWDELRATEVDFEELD